jgi:hypothetical protein
MGMNWVQKLISIDAPEQASLHSASLSFRGSFPWWAAGLVLIAVGSGVVWLYAHESGRFGTLRRLLMAVLRTVSIALLLLLLLRPVLIAEYVGERPRSVALLLDNSQSMMQRDRRLTQQDRLRVAIAEDLIAADTPLTDNLSLGSIPEGTLRDPDRASVVRAVLTNTRLGLANALAGRGPLRAYLFGQRLRNLAGQTGDRTEISAADQVMAAFKADEAHTALADAIRDLLLGKEGELPAAIVVMTDGLDNASKAPLGEVARECARLQVPLHIYGVGSAEGGMLQIKDIGIPDTLFFDDTLVVPVRWRSQGLKTGTVEVTLTLAGQVVAQREVPVREGQDLRDELTFTPHKRGQQEEKQELIASVKLKGNDLFTDTVKRPVQLVDRRVRVLYIEDSPRWEYKFLQTALLRDRRVDASFLLINGDTEALQAGPPFLPGFPARDRLFGFDLVILGDVAAEYFGTEKMTWLRDFVNEGGGLVCIAGRQHLPATYGTTPLTEVLPVEFLPVKFAAAEARPQPYVPVLSEVGQRRDMLALADPGTENLRIWKGLPGLYWHYPATKLRPGAVTLLEHPTLKMGAQAMPILASHSYGKGQILFLATDETWRWRYNVGDRYFTRFWGQIIYEMGLPHLLGNARRVQLALEHGEAIYGRPSSVYARVFDADFRPLKEERLRARLEYLDAHPGEDTTRTIMLEAIPGQPGDYRALLAHDVPGRFELKLDSPEPSSLQYRIDLPPQHELEPAGMAEEALRQAASLSGGRFYREEDLHRLAGQVEPASARFSQRQEVLLWNPLALLLFVGLATAEWIIRKFSNLS